MSRHFFRSLPAAALRALTTLAAFLSLQVSPAAAQSGAEGTSPAVAPRSAEETSSATDPLRVFLVTYGPGEEVWEKFGHNAIWIRDARTGQTRSYNWGMFSFSQPGFVPRLIRGSMLYWLESRDAQEEANIYAYYDRSITVQELALTPEQKAELQAFVQWNEREENRFYNYHYYRDNCSTRVRDALDRVLDGALRAQLEPIQTGQTFRSHSLRLTATAPLAYTGIELGLADSVDQPLNAWEEAFIPMELMRRVRDVRVSDASGNTQPLVLSEQLLYQGRPEPMRQPNRVPAHLLLGTAIGGLFLLLALLVRRTSGASGPPADTPVGRGSQLATSARWLWALLAIIWSLTVGFFGTIVLLLWTSTGHTFTYGNENLLQANPLPLLLVVLAPAAALGAHWARRPAFIIAAFVALLSLLGLLLQALPGFDQMNRDIIALLLPAHLGFAAALYWRKDAGTTTAGDGQAVAGSRAPLPHHG